MKPQRKKEYIPNEKDKKAFSTLNSSPKNQKQTDKNLSTTNLNLKQQQEILQNTLKYFKILTPKEMIKDIEKKESKKSADKVGVP